MDHILAKQFKKKKKKLKLSDSKCNLRLFSLTEFLCSPFCFVRSPGLSAMPEGSYSALHQGPMGEGKDLRNYIYYAPVIAASNLVRSCNTAFGQMTLGGTSGSPGQNREVLPSRVEKYLNWTNGGTKAVCVRRSGERSERPSYSQKLAEELFVWLWSSAKPFHTAEPPRTHAHPPRTCQNHRRPKASVQPAVLTLYRRGGEGGRSNYILF